MKLPTWLSGKTDEPPEQTTPPNPYQVRRQANAEIAEAVEANKVQARADRQQQPGPAARRLTEYPDVANRFKTEGLKPGTEPKEVPERVPTQLKNNPGPQQKPDVQEPEQPTKWVSQLTPTGSRIVPLAQPPKPQEQPEIPEKKSFDQLMADAAKAQAERDRNRDNGRGR